MDDNRLEAFCRTHLAEVKLEGFEVAWEHPGYLSLVPNDSQAPEDSDGVPLGFVVTPDFVNGEPDVVVVEVYWEGEVNSVSRTKVTWTGDVAQDEQTWRAEVDRHRPIFARAIELACSGTNPASEGVDLGVVPEV